MWPREREKNTSERWRGRGRGRRGEREGRRGENLIGVDPQIDKRQARHRVALSRVEGSGRVVSGSECWVNPTPYTLDRVRVAMCRAQGSGFGA